MRIFYYLFFILYLLVSCSSYANNCSQKILGKVDEYLSKLDKFYLEFTQESQEGTSRGILLVEKPSKFRVNYEKPHPLLIAGNKNFISIYDFDLDEFSRISSKDNIFRFLMEKGLKKSDNITVNSCYEDENSYHFNAQESSSQTEATIIFSKNPINLKKLVISNSANLKSNTSINILSSKKLNKIPSNLFLLKNPKVSSKIQRISTDELLHIIN